MLEQVRAAFVEMDGVQPGDPRRGARAVIAAMAQDPPPRRLILGNSGYDAVIDSLEQSLVDIRASESPSRAAGFPPNWAHGSMTLTLPADRGGSVRLSPTHGTIGGAVPDLSNPTIACASSIGIVAEV